MPKVSKVSKVSKVATPLPRPTAKVICNPCGKELCFRTLKSHRTKDCAHRDTVPYSNREYKVDWITIEENDREYPTKKIKEIDLENQQALVVYELTGTTKTQAAWASMASLVDNKVYLSYLEMARHKQRGARSTEETRKTAQMAYNLLTTMGTCRDRFDTHNHFTGRTDEEKENCYKTWECGICLEKRDWRKSFVVFKPDYTTCCSLDENEDVHRLCHECIDLVPTCPWDRNQLNAFKQWL